MDFDYDNNENSSENGNPKYQLIDSIENNDSIYNIKNLISLLKSLNYQCYYEKYDSYVSPLLVAVIKNNIKLAYLLLKNNANIYYNNIFDYLFYKDLITIENLKFLLKNGLKIDENLLSLVISKWISAFNNEKDELIGILINYYLIKNYNEYTFDILKKNYINEQNIYVSDIFQIALNIKNYNAIIKIFKYNNKINNLINILDKILINNDEKYQENKIEEFFRVIKNSNNLNLKLKRTFKTYFMKYLLFKKNDKKELEQFITKNKINLNNFNTKTNDILITAIEYKVKNEIIEYIIKKCHYDTFDYYISNKQDHDYYIPIYSAIANNNFSIAKKLLKECADINYCKDNNTYDIITYLYLRKRLNTENLKFILNNGYDVENNEILMEWINPNMKFIQKNDYTFKMEELNFKLKIKPDIQNGNYIKQSNSFLEIFLKYCQKNSEKPVINSEHYFTALECKNINAIVILLDNEKRNIHNVLNGLRSYFTKSLQLFDDKNLKNFEFYNYKENKEAYIDEIRYKEIINFISNFYNTIEDDINKFKKEIKKEGINVNQLEQFMIKNKMTFSQLNNTDFDVLIYAIEHNIQNDILQSIFKNYITLNYSTSLDQFNTSRILYDERNRLNRVTLLDNNNQLNNNERIGWNHLNQIIRSRRNDIKTPLSAAIDSNRYDTATFLIDHGADINYNDYFTLHEQIELNHQSLKYLLEHGYTVNSNEVYNEILIKYIDNPSNTFTINDESCNTLKLYLNYPPFKEKRYTISYDVYYIIIKHQNFNALLLLYECSEEKNKTIVLSIIIDLLYDNKKRSFLRYLKSSNEHQSKDITKMKSKLYEKLSQFQIMKRKRDELLSFMKTNNIRNNKNLLNHYLKVNDINLKETKSFDFDILIYAIEHHFSKPVIQYILDEVQYETLNYHIISFSGKEKMPLTEAIIQGSLDIANLLKKNGADINDDRIDAILSNTYYTINEVIDKHNDLDQFTDEHNDLDQFTDEHNDLDQFTDEEIDPDQVTDEEIDPDQVTEERIYMDNHKLMFLAIHHFKPIINYCTDENQQIRKTELEKILKYRIFDNDIVILFSLSYKRNYFPNKIQYRNLFIKRMKEAIPDDLYQLAIHRKDLLDILLTFEVDNRRKNKMEKLYNKYKRYTLY